MPLLFIVLGLFLISAVWSYNLYLTQEKAIDRAKALLDHELAKRAAMQGDKSPAVDAAVVEAVALYNEAVADYEALRAHPVCGIGGFLLGKKEKLPYGAVAAPVVIDDHGHGHGHGDEHGHEAVAM